MSEETKERNTRYPKKDLWAAARRLKERGEVDEIPENPVKGMSGTVILEGMNLEILKACKGTDRRPSVCGGQVWEIKEFYFRTGGEGRRNICKYCTNYWDRAYREMERFNEEEAKKEADISPLVVEGEEEIFGEILPLGELRKIRDRLLKIPIHDLLIESPDFILNTKTLLGIVEELVAHRAVTRRFSYQIAYWSPPKEEESEG